MASFAGARCVVPGAEGPEAQCKDSAGLTWQTCRCAHWRNRRAPAPGRLPPPQSRVVCCPQAAAFGHRPPVSTPSPKASLDPNDSEFNGSFWGRDKGRRKKERTAAKNSKRCFNPQAFKSRARVFPARAIMIWRSESSRWILSSHWHGARLIVIVNGVRGERRPVDESGHLTPLRGAGGEIVSKEVGEGEGRARWSGQHSGRSDDATSVDPFPFPSSSSSVQNHASFQ